jgi:hypothetical protein
MALLLECSIRAILVAASVEAVVRGLRIGAAPARHMAWRVVLAVMLLLPAFLTWGPEAGIPILPARQEISASAPPVPDSTPAVSSSVVP